MSDGPGHPARRKRANLADVARAAGVGIATVDRVLNERGNVTPETARKVIASARRLGLRRSLPAPYRRGLRLDVILARPETPFFARLNAAFVRIAATLDHTVIVQRSFVDETRPQQVARRIRATNGHAVVIYGQEDPAVIEAIGTVAAAGVPVVAIVSDLPTAPRLAYVGINHYSAGRTAAFFMARLTRRAGPVIGLCHGFAYRAHADRIAGFRDGLGQHNPDLALGDILQGRDEQALSERLVAEALRRFPDAVGLYNAGGANRAVERALVAGSLARRLVFIGHELTVHTARMLADGVMTLAIDQNPEEQARRAIGMLLRRFGYHDAAGEAPEVPFTIYSPENLAVPPES